MSKVPLAEQIAFWETRCHNHDQPEAYAILATLKIFSRFEARVREAIEAGLAEMKELEADPAAQNLMREFPDAKVTVRDLEAKP